MRVERVEGSHRIVDGPAVDVELANSVLVASGGAGVRSVDGAGVRVPRAQLLAVLRRQGAGAGGSDADGRVRFLGLAVDAEVVGQGRCDRGRVVALRHRR